MSDVGKLERSTPGNAESPEVAEQQGIPGSALADRGQVGGELQYRASGGRGGIAPMQRLIDERRAAGADLSRRIHRKADGGGGGGAGDVEIPSGGGNSLSKDMRQRFEPKLGADLSDVRVHTGGKSAQAAAGIGARAFTVGSDVHFNEGEFSPGSKEGDKLIAHELTHVVQGRKTGIQRKAQEGEEAKGAEGGGAELSHPDDAAEVEADAMGGKVADQLHDKKGGGKGEKGGKAKSGGADAKGGAEGGKDSDAGGEHSAGEGGDHQHGAEGGDAKEKPAPISAKFVGVGRKIMRAKKDDKASGGAPAVTPPAPTPPVVAPGTISGVSSTKTVIPGSKKTDDPNKFVSSKAKYEANFATVKAGIQQRGGTPEQTALFEGRKQEWYSRWGSAALQTDDVAAKAQFTSIQGDLKTMFPDDKPSKDGGHLYTGRTGAGTGRERAEGSMQAANADPKNKGAGITHRTLETTLVGNLFDGVANSPRDAEEQKKWIPYGGSQAATWWSQISAAYADTFVGEVHCHVDIGFPYFVSEEVKKYPSAKEARKPEVMANVIGLQKSVFRDDELPKIAALMGMGKVTKCTFELRMEITPGNFKTASPSIPGAGIAKADQLLNAINAQIKGLVSPTELLANIPDPAASGGAGAAKKA